MSTGSFRDLEVWQQAMLLAEDCYRVTAVFPKQEQFGLALQIRKAVCSIAFNIAEGHSRRSTGAYLYHVSVALGSSGELDNEIELAYRLTFLPKADFDRITTRCTSVGKMLTRLHQSLEERRSREMSKR